MITDRNWRAKTGEIDLVAMCPADKLSSITLDAAEHVLVFAEVRTRRGRGGLAEESITRRKASSMLAAAHAYLESHALDPNQVAWRIDLVAISVQSESIKSINWVKGALDEWLLEP
ncbi:MAG: YraN family protein [Chloroflexota bacterium]|nr:YraN family protein [Chloroflexota bacterium]